MTNDIQDSKSELDPTSGKPLATDEEINMILEKLTELKRLEENTN